MQVIKKSKSASASILMSDMHLLACLTKECINAMPVRAMHACQAASIGCLHSLDWNTGLDYWIEIFMHF